MRATRRYRPWGLLTLAALLAAACGSVPNRHYYALDYPMEPPAESTTRPPLHPYRLRIKPFQVALPYNRPQITYRQSLFEYGYYTFRLWAAKPQHMLRELTERHIESTRLVTEVSREYGEELPDYELKADVQAIEEFDSGDVWYGHMAVRFELVRFRDKVPVWTYRFDRKRKVFEKKPVYVVRALSHIAEEELDRVVAMLDEVMSRERGVASTIPLPPPADDDLTNGVDGAGEGEGTDAGAAEMKKRPAPKRDVPLTMPDDPDQIIGPDGPVAPDDPSLPGDGGVR